MSYKLPVWSALMACVLAFAPMAKATRWEPIDVSEVDSLDAVAMSARMAEDPTFGQLMIDRYFFSGPEVRSDFLTRWKGAALMAESEDAKAVMVEQLQSFKQLPLASFHYFEFKGVSTKELEEHGRSLGVQVHSAQTSAFLGLVGKKHFVLVSGPQTGLDAFLHKFKYKLTFQESVDEFRLEVKYKVGANWAEMVVPTGQRYRRDFGMVDAWTAAGIFSKLAEGPEGVRKLIEKGVITLHEGQAEVGSISNVSIKAFMPYVPEPFYSN